MSERKIVSNRQNASLSTGPRTALGKKRASRNALRHGLAVDIRSNVSLSAEVDRLARIISTNSTEQRRLAQARKIAEASIDLSRVRSAKLPLLEGLSSIVAATCGDEKESRPANSQGFAANLAMPSDFLDICRQLERLDRYERRAFSRLLKCIRMF